MDTSQAKSSQSNLPQRLVQKEREARSERTKEAEISGEGENIYMYISPGDVWQAEYTGTHKRVIPPSSTGHPLSHSSLADQGQPINSAGQAFSSPVAPHISTPSPVLRDITGSIEYQPGSARESRSSRMSLIIGVDISPLPKDSPSAIDWGTRTLPDNQRILLVTIRGNSAPKGKP